MARMVPAATELSLKLDIIGRFGCPRWHQDDYTGRAIVSYNLCGTDFIAHKYVDFWELQNCGNEDHIIRDRSQIFSAEVGDIMFMKGNTFPVGVQGLVHRSPENAYHPNGKVMHRL